MQTETVQEFIARQRAEHPYVLNYTRRGGRNSGVGLQVGCRIARSREDAEAQRRLMELSDAAHGHITTYEIAERTAN